MKSKARHQIERSSFFCLKSKRKLAALLGLTLPQLRALLRRDFNSMYRVRDEKDERGKIRRIEESRYPLKRVQQRISGLLMRIEPPSFLHCPAIGRSYVTNARVHRRGQSFVTLDIKNYYPSTTAKKVYWFFAKLMNCSPDVAAVLVRIVTINEHVPTGAPSSAIICFYAHHALWDAIDELAKSASLEFSLYQDDLTFSGEDVQDATIWKIKKEISKNGLRYHKERRRGSGRAEVTGVLIDNGALRLPNRKHKKLSIYLRKLQTMQDPDGHDTLVKSIKGQQAQLKYVKKLDKS